MLNKFTKRCAVLIFFFCLPVITVAQTQPEKGSMVMAESAQLDLHALTGRAGLIFTGVVSALEYETDKATGMVYTYVTFRQIQSIKNITNRFKDPDEKLRMRLWGGLREDGKYLQKIPMPVFELGRIYLVFFKAGFWNYCPVVGWNQGYFRVVHSEIVGDAILFDHAGKVVVGIEGQTIESLPLNLKKTSDTLNELPGDDRKSGTRLVAPPERPDQFKRGADIYSEENVKKLLESEAPQIEVETAKKERESLTDRAQAIKDLPRSLVKLGDIVEAIKSSDKKNREIYAKDYSKVIFDPPPLPEKFQDGVLKKSGPNKEPGGEKK